MIRSVSWLRPAAAAAHTCVDTDDASAGRAGPQLPLALQKSGHHLLPDEPQILQRGFAERVLRSVPGLLFHDVGAGKIRALIAEQIPVRLSLFAQNDAASL